jgi:hypothetical protein
MAIMGWQPSACASNIKATAASAFLMPGKRPLAWAATAISFTSLYGIMSVLIVNLLFCDGAIFDRIADIPFQLLGVECRQVVIRDPCFHVNSSNLD